MDGLKQGLRRGDALIVVDVQCDFLPGGALGVPEGHLVVDVLNRYMQLFDAAELPIVLTRDWHPVEHCSFASQGGPWPPHCMAGSEGAEFAPSLRVPDSAQVISKATSAGEDAYSGFQGTRLAELLREQGIRRLFIGGLATDYCVLATVQDALKEGFEVLLLTDAIRAVNLHPGDGERAVKAMREAGARTVSLADFHEGAS